MEWSVPPMWLGQSAVILGSGPSMNADVAAAVRYVTRLRVIAINNTYQLAPWADILYAADQRWWDVHKKEAMQFMGLKVSVEATTYPEVLKLKNSGSIGFDDDPANLRTGGNSGYQAVQIAVHAGVTRILLCGFDMRPGHWHPDHKEPLRNTEEGAFIRWRARFAELADILRAKGIDVWNCTPDSALTCFEMVPLSPALDRIMQLEAA